MPNLSRRNFIKGSALVPLISPMAVMARLSENKINNFDSNEAWVRRARNSIPATKDPFYQTAGIAPSPKSVMNVVAEKLHFHEMIINEHIRPPQIKNDIIDIIKSINKIIK